MTFTSFNFLLIFPFVVLLYNLVPQKWKNLFLLAVSYLLYIKMQPIYALLLLLVTTTTYFFARKISKEDDDDKRSKILRISVILVLLPLFFYKYFNFVNESIASVLTYIGVYVDLPQINYLLPVGISFYTFMAIGYLVDVNNEEIEFQKSFANTSLFLSFFPVILSGPIERAKNMFPQFNNLKNSTYNDLSAGFKMLLWGYFMKLCVADRLAIYVDTVFNNLANHNGTTITFASLIYPLQEYADFGGYSIMAIGVARCMGINVIVNFKRPFFSTSMSELWRRWHMSLMQWIVDYIYTPLAFNWRKWKLWGMIAAIFVAFIISGIWHGAAMTFITWGILQGFYVSFDAILKKWRQPLEVKHNLLKKWWYVLPSCIVVYVLFAFSEMVSKCNSITEANMAIYKMLNAQGPVFIDKTTLLFGILSAIILLLKDIKDEYHIKFNFMHSKYIFIRYVSVLMLIWYILQMGVLDGGQFIYFQF